MGKHSKGKENKQTRRKRWYKAVCSLAAAVVVCTVYTLMLPALTLDEESAGDAGITISESAVPTSETPATENNDIAADSSADSSPAEQESGTAAAAPSDDSAPADNKEPTPDNNEQPTPPTEEENNVGEITGNSESQDEITDPEPNNEENNNDANTNTDINEEDDSNKSDDTADVETSADWIASVHNAISADNWNEMTWAEKLLAVAETQLGYKESVLNFRVDNDGNHKGYTRYGAWYGSPYGDWCAMFVSFCLNYSGINEEAIPQNANCADWVKNLDNMGIYEDADLYVPEAGDIVFFDQNDANRPNHVGIISEVTYGTKTVIRHITKDGSAVESGAMNALKYINAITNDDASGDELQTEEVEVPVAESIKVIEGNSSDQVQYVTYDLNNEKILGYVSLTNARNVFEGIDTKPEEQPVVETPTVKEYEVAGDYKITATYTSDAKLPESTTLKARELTGDEYDEHYQMALEELGVEELSFARFFDITFESADGFKLEPAADSTVDIQISYYDDNNKPEIKENETANAVHFGENGTEVLPVETTGDPESVESMSFTQSSFSVTGTVVSSNSNTINGTYVILSGNSGNVNALVNANNRYGVSAKVDGTTVVINSLNSANSIGISITNGDFYFNSQTYTLTKIRNSNSYYATYQTSHWNGRWDETQTYYLIYNGYNGWTTTDNPTRIYLSNNYKVSDTKHTVTFNENGGSVTPDPQRITVDADDEITFPEYNGTKSDKVFVGWSTKSNATSLTVGTSFIYKPGETKSVTEDTLYYATWADISAAAGFFVRLDGVIPKEPASYTTKVYTDIVGGAKRQNVLKEAAFYTNNAGNGVADKLYANNGTNGMPSDQNIVDAINAKSKVNTITDGGNTYTNKYYNINLSTTDKSGVFIDKNTQKKYTVMWYVIKLENDGWHVDGTLLDLTQVNLRYEPNCPDGEWDANNFPVGAQYDVNDTVIPGETGGKDGTVKTPTRTGYTFVGWTTEANGSGEKYTGDKNDPNNKFTITEDTTLYAQWVKNTTGVLFKKVSANGNTPLTGAVFVLKKWDDAQNVFVYYKGTEESSKINITSTSGKNIDALEDGKYELIELTAPDGYNLLSESIEFEIKDKKIITPNGEMVEYSQSSAGGWIITIKNKLGYELPETGGTGTTLLYLLGALLTTATLTITFIKRRRSEGREN